MTLSKSNYTKGPASLATNHSEAEEQIVQLKRLLITLKQKYEDSLKTLNQQLQTEAAQKQELQQEIEKMRLELQEAKAHSHEEITSLQKQQAVLKDMLKKAEEELKKGRETESQGELLANQQRNEQLERLIPYLSEKVEAANKEVEQTREELQAAQKKIKLLQTELANEQRTHQQKLEALQQSIDLFQQDSEHLEDQPGDNIDKLRHELELIKQTLIRGAQETRVLEERYVEILNEKTNLENLVKKLQDQLIHYTRDISAFENKIHTLEGRSKDLESQLKNKEEELKHERQTLSGFESKMKQVEKQAEEKDLLQEKYEQLREELCLMQEKLDEAVEVRLKAENERNDLQALYQEERKIFEEKELILNSIQEEQERARMDVQELRSLLEESESRLKVAQQHLAKKVKEAALLSEKVDDLHSQLMEQQQICENAKAQVSHLQTNVELYQKQEKRLQEQLHEALKSTENQVSKWEEKYFKMYDKWQESEARIRELKKFEEKHHQMQSLLANLGTFMGSSFTQPSPLLHPNGPESLDKGVRSPSVEIIQGSVSPSLEEKEETVATEEKYDLFGMRHPTDKVKKNLFS
jgi:chromosome segregation ATPase